MRILLKRNKASINSLDAILRNMGRQLLLHKVLCI